MSTERMSGRLGLLNIYREREINAEQVVDIFAGEKIVGLHVCLKCDNLGGANVCVDSKLLDVQYKC